MNLGIFFIALAGLLLELTLIRIFDVLWYPNMAFMVITLAVFFIGLAGVYLSIWPFKKDSPSNFLLAMITLAMAVWVGLLEYGINQFPFDYTQLTGDQSLKMSFNFLATYFLIGVPFFIEGVVLAAIFSKFTRDINKLYFWDLVGAGLSGIVLILLLPKLGTVGLTKFVAGICVIAAACFLSNRKTLKIILLGVGIVVSAYPIFTAGDQIKTFKPQMNKRGYKELSQVISEGTWWDPISKIDIINVEALGTGLKKRWIAYDGGTQTSYFYSFDGDLEKLRKDLPEGALNHFWHKYVPISHYLKADSGSEVLIIGSAGGQELKAALAYNPKHVDAVELVGKVVDLGKNEYAEYIGNIMNDPRANVQKAEGRTFLRSSGKIYDIIQIFSNHTSSSIAAGSGSMQPSYLQTVDAYKEYFTHLSDNGILHINHHVYPKMVATAAEAWVQLGRKDFRKHVQVYESANATDNLPTMLIKMSPWTGAEVNETQKYLSGFANPVNPFEPAKSFLSDEFFNANFPKSLANKIPYRVTPGTDDKPFFNSLRKNFDDLPQNDSKIFVNPSVSGLLNSQKASGYSDVIHLLVTCVAALVFAILFTFVPLLLSKTGKEKWSGKRDFMILFSMLGFGFIILELVFIQIFMKLIGYPLYTYTTVLFTFLVGAGFGSLISSKIELTKRFPYFPYLLIISFAIFTLVLTNFLFDSLLGFDVITRVIASVLIMLPLTIALGMPFPLGMLAIENKPTGTVAWAWAYNGLFTIIGGVFCSIAATYIGFTLTALIAVLAYCIGALAYGRLLKS